MNDAEIYFVANTSNARQNVNATFRVGNMQAESWDPMTGSISGAQLPGGTGQGGVRLDLAPYESRVLVFSRRALAPPMSAGPSTIISEIDLSSGWLVAFGDSGKPAVMDHLRSWTEDEETRYFSGVATYEKNIDVKENMLQQGVKVRLDFGAGTAIPQLSLRAGMQAWLEGPVREAAVVYVNGQRAGSVWCPPYSIDLTRQLRRGENKLRIVVGNLAINYMAGHRLPDYRLLNLRYGERFQAQDMDKVRPVPSGLLGSIRLVAFKDR
jgi:alpha-L-rhamnosidase